MLNFDREWKNGIEVNRWDVYEKEQAYLELRRNNKRTSVKSSVGYNILNSDYLPSFEGIE